MGRFIITPKSNLAADYPFRTHGDTEVILAGYIQWGADCLSRLRGMFTIVIWDKQERDPYSSRAIAWV